MDENTKTTRRVAIGVGIAGVALSPLILRILKNINDVEIPTSTSTPLGSTLSGTTTVRVHGRKIGPIELPKMQINSTEDMDKYNELVLKTIREQTHQELTGYSEDERQALVAEYVDKEIKKREAQIRNIDSQSLFESLSERIPEDLREQLRDDLAQLNDDEKARMKAHVKSSVSENLASWKDGEGQAEFEARMEEALFGPLKPLAEKQQEQVSKQVTQQRLERLRDGSFEKSIRQSLKRNFHRLVESGKLHKDQAERAVEQGTESALRKEREWAALMSSAS